jgi:hypothetical protein
MGKIGKCCCGCSGCCISRIDIDFAVPTGSGSALGSFGWDIDPEDQPEIVNSTDPSTGEPVCAQTYYAPTYQYCPDLESTPSDDETLNINCWFNYRTRTFTKTIKANLTVGMATAKVHFTGGETWKDNVFVRDLQVTIYRTPTRVKTFMSAQLTRELIRYPSPGSTFTIYDAECDVFNTFDYDDDYDSFVCTRFDPASASCYGSGYSGSFCYYPWAIFQGYYTEGLAATSNFEDGACAQLPTQGEDPSIFGEYYAGSASTCRMPSGQTSIDEDEDICEESKRLCTYNYNAYDAYFCNHQIAFELC